MNYEPKHINTVESDYNGTARELVWCDRKAYPYEEVKYPAAGRMCPLAEVFPQGLDRREISLRIGQRRLHEETAVLCGTHHESHSHEHRQS